MLEIIASLPQGVFWYPLAGGVLVTLVRALFLTLENPRSAQHRGVPRPETLVAYADLVERARTSQFAEAELERLCLGMLLQANGYRTYTIDACRAYLANEAPPQLVPVIEEHLGDRAPTRRPESGALPARAELFVLEIERITEEHHG